MNIDTNRIINYFLYNLIIYVISQILIIGQHSKQHSNLLKRITIFILLCVIIIIFFLTQTFQSK